MHLHSASPFYTVYTELSLDGFDFITTLPIVRRRLFVRFRDGRVTDFFQQRLVFPYWRRGRVVYFIARQTELTPEAPWEQAKYKKLLTRSGKHPYVSALVQNDTFYNEDAATRGRVRQLLVTEGVTDCISAMQAGVPAVPIYDANSSALNDITGGNNPGCATEGFYAQEGWDPVTGLGTPDFRRLSAAVAALPY